MKKLLLLLTFAVWSILFGYCQSGASINTTGAAADPSAILDVNSADLGVLIPRVSLTATNSNLPIGSNISTSLLVYNTATTSNNPLYDVSPGYYYWDGTSWVKMATVGSNSGGNWLLSGNSGTNPGTDYIGTSDGQDVVFKTNNTENLRLQNGGNFGVGTSIPLSTIDINGSVAARTSVANINSSSLVVNTSNSSHIILISTGATPSTPWLFTLTDGQPGQLLVLELQSGYASLAYSGNTVLTSPYANFLYPYSILTLKWNDIDSAWVEISRNGFLNSSSVYYGNKQVFTYTGSAQTFTVPPYVNQIFVKMWGAGGGFGATSGGSGAFASGYLSVTPGVNLTVIVGGGGIHTTQANTSDPGGYGGGGASGAESYSGSDGAGSGGGRSAVQITAGVDAATAGGGGGAASYYKSSSPQGGGGGATNGSDGGVSVTSNGYGGKGGTLVAGGAGGYNGTDLAGSAGSQYTGGAGAGGSSYSGGGGGGGYYGGGGGGRSGAQTRSCGGGGGGSSFVSNLASATNVAGSSGSSTAPNNSDTDYITGVGKGGYPNGGPGLVVIYW